MKKSTFIIPKKAGWQTFLSATVAQTSNYYLIINLTFVLKLTSRPRNRKKEEALRLKKKFLQMCINWY